jgi:hypothetical protein
VTLLNFVMPTDKRKRASNDNDSFHKMSRTTEASNIFELVFPFGASDIDTDRAAEGLSELGRASTFSKLVVPFGDDTNGASDIDTDRAAVVPFDDDTYSPFRFLVIGKEENECLKPQGWLNDALVDFWMQWYVACRLLLLDRCACMSHTTTTTV